MYVLILNHLYKIWGTFPQRKQAHEQKSNSKFIMSLICTVVADLIPSIFFSISIASPSSPALRFPCHCSPARFPQGAFQLRKWHFCVKILIQISHANSTVSVTRLLLREMVSWSNKKRKHHVKRKKVKKNVKPVTPSNVGWLVSWSSSSASDWIPHAGYFLATFIIHG